MNDKQELEYQLKKIKTYIKNCEFDLNGMFPDNHIIKNKLEVLKKQKIDIEQKLESIEDN